MPEIAETTRVAELIAAIEPLLGTMNFYFGPNARTAVSREKINEYEHLRLCVRRVKHEPCHKCDDTGINQEFKDGITRPCPLRKDPMHRIDPPQSVIDYMILARDNGRHNHDVMKPQYEDELAEMGIE